MEIPTVAAHTLVARPHIPGRAPSIAATHVVVVGADSAYGTDAPAISTGIAAAPATALHGTVHVYVSHATGLKSVDRNGVSDPYVRLALCGQTARTRTIKKSLNPVWHETLRLTGVLSELTADQMLLCCRDYDFARKDDSLGDARVGLTALLTTGSVCDFQIPLSIQGVVYLRVAWQADGEPPPPPPFTSAADTSAARLQATARGRHARMATASLRVAGTAVHTAEALGSRLGESMREGMQVMNEGVQGAVKSTSRRARNVGMDMHIMGSGGRPAVSDGDVDAPTPADRWFSPRDGWGNATDCNGRAPTLMMPTARTAKAEALFPLESEAIGELRLEVCACVDSIPHTRAHMQHEAIGKL